MEGGGRRGKGKGSAQREKRRIRFEFAMPRVFPKVREKKKEAVVGSKHDDQ